MTFLNPTGEANMYVWFGYNPQTILYCTQGQVSGLINSDPENAKNRSTINKGSI